MAYFYNEDVYNLTNDVKDLQQRIENNFTALVRNFQGPTAPEPAQTFVGQLWYDTTSNKIKIRSGTGWVEIFDVANQAAPIGDNAVTTQKISDAARKGTIVKDQNIDPSACTLRAKPTCSSYPFRATSDTEVSVSVPPGQVQQPFLSGLIYVPNNSENIRIKIEARISLATQTCNVYAKINGNNISAAISSTSFSFLSLNLSTSVTGTGWLDIVFGFTSNFYTTAYYRGYCMMSGE